MAQEILAAVKRRAGRPVGLVSVRLFDFIVSLAFRVKGRRRRFWPRLISGLRRGRTFSFEDEAALQRPKAAAALLSPKWPL